MNTVYTYSDPRMTNYAETLSLETTLLQGRYVSIFSVCPLLSIIYFPINTRLEENAFKYIKYSIQITEIPVCTTGVRELWPMHISTFPTQLCLGCIQTLWLYACQVMAGNHAGGIAII